MDEKERKRRAARTRFEAIREDNTGRCLAAVGDGCSRKCSEYEHDRVVDSFRTCTCGHTQNIHAVRTVE